MAHLSTAKAVVDALGGNVEVTKRYGVSQQRVHGWRKRNVLPPDLFERINDDVEALGHTVDLRLWKTVPVSALVACHARIQALLKTFARKPD